MKRRNFLSGLLAAPLAVKARLARSFVPARAEVFGGVFLRSSGYTRRFPKNFLQLVAEGKSLEEAAGPLIEIAPRKPRKGAFLGPRCSRPLGHKGPHMLLNTSWVVKKEGSLRER